MVLPYHHPMLQVVAYMLNIVLIATGVFQYIKLELCWAGLGAGIGVANLLVLYFNRTKGALAAMWQPLGSKPPAREAHNDLVRADLAFLAIELVLIGLLLANLYSSSASHAAAASLITTGSHALAFWAVVVALGILVPIALQSLELSHRIPHTVVPALLVLAGLAGCRAGVVCTVFAHRPTGRFIEGAQMDRAEAACIGTGLEALCLLAEMDESVTAAGERHWRPSLWAPMAS